MAKLTQFGKITRRFANFVDFLIIYVDEAHPTDGFAMTRRDVSIRNHRNLDERIKAAQTLKDQGVECDVAVDDISNPANEAYGVHDERLYIIQNDRVMYAGKYGMSGYSLDEVKEWLEMNIQHTKE